MNWLQKIAYPDQEDIYPPFGDDDFNDEDLRYDPHERFFEDESGQTFWGKQGSGVLFIRNHPKFGPQILACLRSSQVEQPGTWGTTGGAVPSYEEDIFRSALRETKEELGQLPPFRRVSEYVWQAPGGSFKYTTFILEVTDPTWEPHGPYSWEVDDAEWVSPGDLGEYDLHFGLADLLDEKQLF